jgi:hypothetical protein
VYFARQIVNNSDGDAINTVGEDSDNKNKKYVHRGVRPMGGFLGDALRKR